MNRPLLAWRVATRLCIALAMLMPAQHALARPQAEALRDGETLRLDGTLDEPVWQRAPVLERFYQYRPVDRQPAPAAYRTTVQVILEGDALVIGVRAYDPQPAQIRAPLVRRDRVLRDQDFVAVVLDAVGDRRSGQFLRVNAAGVVADGMYIADGDVEDFAPDFEFDAAAQRLPDGYSVEMRLPFLALRYPLRGGAPWRLMVARNVPREAGMLLLSAPLTQDAVAFIAELQEIGGLQGTEERLGRQSLLNIRPELTARATRDRSGGTSTRERDVSLGVDIKWRPRADWVFDATLNPDFSQVELDEPQLAGNTRFALSVPEKRPFFLESTDVLDLPLVAFYSRSITDPQYGVRGTWRGNSAEAAGLTMRDRGGGLVLLPRAFDTGVVGQDGTSQASLLRARLHFGGEGGERWHAGTLLSSRRYGGSRDNQVAGADLGWQPDDGTQLRLRTLVSQTTAGFDAAGLPVLMPRVDGSRWHLTAFRRVPGWQFSAQAGRTGAGFRNDNGFVDQAGVRWGEVEVIRRFGATSLPLGVQTHEFENYWWFRRVETTAGEAVEQRFHPGFWMTGGRNSEAWVELRLDRQRVKTGGTLHPTTSIGGGYSLSPSAWFTNLNTELAFGERVDTDPRVDRVGRGAVWLVEAKFKFPLGAWGVESEHRAQAGTIDGSGSERALSDRAARWLGVLHFDARDSLRVLWQAQWYDRAAQSAPAPVFGPERSRSQSTSLVFQHRFAPGRSFSIGASRQQGGPGEPVKEEVFVKSALLLF